MSRLPDALWNHWAVGHSGRSDRRTTESVPSQVVASGTDISIQGMRTRKSPAACGSMASSARQAACLCGAQEAGLPEEGADGLYRPIPIFSADLLQRIRAPDAHQRVAAFEPRYESRDGVANRFHEPVNYRPSDVTHPRRSEAGDEIVEVLPNVLPGEVAEARVARWQTSSTPLRRLRMVEVT